MSQLEQAARQGIAVLSNIYFADEDEHDRSEIINAIENLESALAQQEKPKPVYFRWVIHGEPIDTIFKVNDLPDKDTLKKWKINGRDIEYLYTEQPHRRDEPRGGGAIADWVFKKHFIEHGQRAWPCIFKTVHCFLARRVRAGCGQDGG